MTASKSGYVRLWDLKKKKVIFKFQIQGEPACIAACSVNPILVVGSKSGVIRLYDISKLNENKVRLLLREKLFDGPVKKV